MNRPFLIIILFSWVHHVAQSQTFDWARKLGGNMEDYSASVTVDGAGNVYTTGYFLGTCDFNPGPAVNNLVSVGQSDIYISKLDANGNYLWAKRIGGNSWDDGTQITTDAAGNIYLTGLFSGTCDFDPGAGTFLLASAGGYDMFTCKLDNAGNFVWARRIGNANNEYCTGLKVNANSEIFITGFFYGTVDFNPGGGVNNLVSSGSADFFILKLDATGNYMWAKQIGGMNADQSYTLDFDGMGNVFITGGYNGTVDFNPGVAVFNLTAVGSEDIFVLKLDALGNFLWTKTIGGIHFDSANGLTVDGAGDVYLVGNFDGTVDFDPNAGVANVTVTGSSIFICKLNALGNFVWAKSLSAAGYIDAFSLDAGTNGCVAIAGCFTSTVDFNPNIGVFNISPLGSQDIFIVMLESNGNFLWAKSLAGAGNTGCAMSLFMDVPNNIYTSGFFTSTVDFNPDAGTYNLTSSGLYDIFVHKMSYGNNPLPVTFVDFNGKSTYNNNYLYWTTASELNNKQFAVLKSFDGDHFEIIGYVDAVGNSQQYTNYTFIDYHVTKQTYYYKLQQIDNNGLSTFSKTISLAQNTPKDNPILVTPNPATNYVQLEYAEHSTSDGTIEILNAAGKLVMQVKKSRVVDVSRLQSGSYIIRWVDGNTINQQRFEKL